MAPRRASWEEIRVCIVEEGTLDLFLVDWASGFDLVGLCLVVYLVFCVIRVF